MSERPRRFRGSGKRLGLVGGLGVAVVGLRKVAGGLGRKKGYFNRRNWRISLVQHLQATWWSST